MSGKTQGQISDRVHQVSFMIMTGNRRLGITGPCGSTTGRREREKKRSQQIARKVSKGKEESCVESRKWKVERKISGYLFQVKLKILLYPLD